MSRVTKNTFWLTLTITFLVVSCDNNAKQIDKTAASLKYLGEVVLSHGDLLLSSYAIANYVVGQDSLLVYDQQSKQLVLFDLQRKIPIYTIDVVLDGPDFFDPLFQDAEIRNDSLFLLSRKFFSVYNLDGKILMRFGHDELGVQKLTALINDFHLSDNTVIFSKVPVDVLAPNFRSPEKPNIFFTLNLLTRSVSEIEVFSPKESLIEDMDKGYYNDFAFHSMAVSKDSIIYSFPFSSKTYLLDLANNKQTELETPFKSVENLRVPINANEINEGNWANYAYSSSRFSGIERDSKTGYFVRVALKVEKVANAENKDYRYLMLINDKFEVVEEIKLPGMLFIEPVVSNGIIYLFKGGDISEGGYLFVAYEIVT